MLRISSTYLASGNFLCTFCKRWRRDGKQFQVMAFIQGFERRYITSCQNTIKWTMTRLPYMSGVKYASSYTSRIDQKCLKSKTEGEAITPRKRDGRCKAITLLNCNISRNTSEQRYRKQIHSGKIESTLSLIERKNVPKRTISKAIKVMQEESLAKKNQRLIRQSEEQKLKTLEKLGKTVKMKSNYKMFGIGNSFDRTKSRLKPRINIGKNGAIWDRVTSDKADKAFVQFQEMLRVPESIPVEKFLHKQDLRRKSRAKSIKKKIINVFKVSDPHVKQRLQKNKINVEIYDQTHLLKEDEPQCEFAEVQCGRKKLYIAFLEDGTPENVEDKLLIKTVAPGPKVFPEKLMKMMPATLSKITPEKLVKMIRDGKTSREKLIKMIHDNPPKGGPEKPRNGSRDRSLQLKIPRKNADLKVVVNIKKPQENMSRHTIHFKQKTPNGIVAKTMKFQIKRVEKYLFLTNNGKIRIRYLTGGLTNIKQRLIEKIEIPKILKCPVAISGQGKIVFYEKTEDPKSMRTVEDTCGTSFQKSKESLVQKFKLLNLKPEDKPEVNKETERKYLFRILKRKTRKVANEKIDDGKLIEAQLNNNVSETFSKFDTLLQSMAKPKESQEKETKLLMKSDQGKKKTPAEALPPEQKISLPKDGNSLINKEEVIQYHILPKPKTKPTIPAWREIEKINKEKQAELSKICPSQLIDPYFVQLQQQKFKRKEIQKQAINEAEPTTVSSPWYPTYQGTTLTVEEQVQQWNQTAPENPAAEKNAPFPETHENTQEDVESLSPSQQDQPQTNQNTNLQETPAAWSFPDAETQPKGQTSEASMSPLEKSGMSNLRQSPKNDFYYPELRNHRSRRPNLPPPITDKETTHFVSLLPEPEQSLVPIDVQHPSIFTETEVQMCDTQLEETINKPLVEDMKLKDLETILRDDLLDYLPESIMNKWNDKNWDVRQSWETSTSKVPNLRKLVRANSGNADYVHSFIIESDTLGECYRAFRPTPDFTPKTTVEYNFKYDQEPEMRMFENVVAQNFTRVDDPDFIQVKRLRNDKAKVETTVTSVTVIHPELKIAPEFSSSPQNTIHSTAGLSTQHSATEGENCISRESTPNQNIEHELKVGPTIKPVFQRLELLDASRNVAMPCTSQINEARENIYPERDSSDPSPTQNIQSIGFRLGAPEKYFSTVSSVEDALSQRREGSSRNEALSEKNAGEITTENGSEAVEKQEKQGKNGNPKVFVSDSGRSTRYEEFKSPKSRDKPKLKQEEKITKKCEETSIITADASNEKNNITVEAKQKNSTEKAKEETDPKFKEEIMQKLKDELSSKLKNEWKVKLFDELADRIKPVIELKLTSDKPKNQIYLEKTKSEKLEAQKEQLQVKDQLKEELKELKEELKKIKMKEELKHELKSELKGEFTSRTEADIQALNSEPVRIKSEKINEESERESVRRKSESIPIAAGQKVSTIKDEKIEKDIKWDGYDYYQNSVSLMPGWYDSPFGNNPGQQTGEKENQPSRSDIYNHGDANRSTLEKSEFKRKVEKDTGNSPHHLPQKEHPYLPRRDKPLEKEQPRIQPQHPHTQPNYKDHPYLPKWEPIPPRKPPSEPLHPRPLPPNQPYYPHTQPPHHPYQPQPETPCQPYQPLPQQPNQPTHPPPQIPNQPYEPQTQPPNKPPQPQTPNYSLNPPTPTNPNRETSQYENKVHHPYWNQIISTPTEESILVQNGNGERNYKEEAQPQKSWEPSSDPPKIDEAQTQPFHSLDEEALSQSRQKYFKLTLPRTKMEEGKRTEDLKAKQKEEQDSVKKQDETIINQQSRAKFFRSLIPEKKNSEEKPNENNQKEENQGKKHFRILLPDQKTQGKFMKFKGDQKKPKGAKKEELEKGKPNKTPGEIKLKELPPTKPEIKKSSDNKPAEILVKSIETVVEQSRKSEMETAKQVEASEQKKLIKQQQEAAVQKEPETRKQLDAVEQKELLRQQQEAAAKRDLEIRKQQEEKDREYKEALEANRREELARRVPGIAGYGAIILEHQATPVVRSPPDKKPDDPKDKSSSDEKNVRFPGPETMTEKKSNPEEKGAANKEKTPTERTSAERLKSFMDPFKFGTVSTLAEKQTLEDDKNKPSSAEAPPKKALDKMEKLSPLLEWEKKILGGSDKPKIDEGKKDKISTKSDSEREVHDIPKAPEEDSKFADLGKRKSNLSEWEKEIGELTNSFYGGVPEPIKTSSDEKKATEEKKTTEPDLVPRKEESMPPDEKSKMQREDDSEVLKARVEQYLNIYGPPKKGRNDTDSGSPITTTMTHPDIEQYDRSDVNDFFSAGLKASDFNLYLSQEETEEVLKYNQKTHQKDPKANFVTTDQTNVSPPLEKINLLMEPAAKFEATLTPEQESSVHVVKVVFKDKKSGVGIEEENKQKSPEEANEKELRSFVDLLRNVLPSEQREGVKIFLEKEANPRKKIDGEKGTCSNLNLCMKLLKMAITNSKNEIFQNKSHAKALTDLGNNDVNLQPFVEFLKRTITSTERPNSRVLQEGKLGWAENMEAEKEKDRLGSYLDLFRKAVDSAEHEAKEKRILQTGTGDVQRNAEVNFQSFLQILKETIGKMDNQAQKAFAQGEQFSKKMQQDQFNRDSVVHTSKKHISLDRIESAKNKNSSDQSEVFAARSESKEAKTKIEGAESSRKAGKEKTQAIEDHPESNISMKEGEKKTKETGEEGTEGSKKTIQVDKIIVNIKADPEEKETSEKRRKPGRKILRKLEEVPEEELAEKQEKSTKKKKYRKKKFEEETIPKKKQEFLEEKRRRKIASISEDDSKKLTKMVPEKEPELEPGSNLMSEIEEETTSVEYNSSQGDYPNKNSREVREISPKPKKESFMGEEIVKEFTIREEPFDIEPVSGKNKAGFSKKDVQCVEGNIRAARADKGYTKEGKRGKFPRTILPDSPNVEIGSTLAEEQPDQNDEGSAKLGKKISKTFFGKEHSKMEEVQKAVKEEKFEEEPVKFAESKRDSKGYLKSPKKNVSGITQKRDLQTLATATLKNADGKREPNCLILRKLVGNCVEEDPPVGESVLGDSLRHRIASAPYRKTKLSHSEKEISRIKDKTELKKVRVMEEVGEISTGEHLIEAVAKKANEIPCAVAIDPENPSPPLPPVLAGAVLLPGGRKTKTKFWWEKMEHGKK